MAKIMDPILPVSLFRDMGPLFSALLEIQVGPKIHTRYGLGAPNSLIIKEVPGPLQIWVI